MKDPEWFFNNCGLNESSELTSLNPQNIRLARRVYDDLRRENEELRESSYPGYKREKRLRIKAEKEAEELRTLLKESEWKMNNNCWKCGERAENGHASNCRLAKVLGGQK